MNDEDFTIEWGEPFTGQCYISDVRITRGKALYCLPWWKRFFKPWTVWRFRRKPMKPSPFESVDG